MGNKYKYPAYPSFTTEELSQARDAERNYLPTSAAAAMTIATPPKPSAIARFQAFNRSWRDKYIQDKDLRWLAAYCVAMVWFDSHKRAMQWGRSNWDSVDTFGLVLAMLGTPLMLPVLVPLHAIRLIWWGVKAVGKRILFGKE